MHNIFVYMQQNAPHTFLMESKPQAQSNHHDALLAQTAPACTPGRWHPLAATWASGKLIIQPLQPSSFTDSDRQWQPTTGPRPVTPALGHCSHLELTRSPVWPVVTVTVWVGVWSATSEPEVAGMCHPSNFKFPIKNIKLRLPVTLLCLFYSDEKI